MAIFYVQYEDSGGSRRWMPVQAESGDQARDEVAAMGFGVLRVAHEGEDIDRSAGRRPVAATASRAQQPELLASRPPRALVTELEARQLFWMIVGGVVLAMAIWWLISLALGWAILAVWSE